MIDTVTFDLWNTLISNRPPDHYRYKQIRVERIIQVLKRNGLTVRLDDLSLAYDEGFEKCKETWKNNRDLSTPEQLGIMMELLPHEKPKSISPALMQELVEVFTSPLLDDPPPLIDGAKEVVTHIQEEKYKTGLICNTGRTPGSTIRLFLERSGMLNCFDITTFSNELRIRKPDPRIFLHTLNQIKSLPMNSVHVGDMLELDVLGAKNAGMISVHYAPVLIPQKEIIPDFTISHLSGLGDILKNLK